ncbi:hypothetical protein ACOACO_02740 [Nocardioides sp. CPCC 205120]|uniref:hypothetical protein n=1 Tax=Nocardioides sp. CPCC 205120 TaxID=3406462 RepID=UPI003B51468E
MIPSLIAISAVVLLAVGCLLWDARTRRRRRISVPAYATDDNEHRVFPTAGLLVSETILQSAGSDSETIWAALETAAAPVAVEYFPVSASELTKYRTVPVSAVQKPMVDIVNALNPSSPTLYRVVLPKGAELVEAMGVSGFRGFSRTGGKTTHAVLKPVAAGGAIAAGWPAFAIAGAVMAVDMMAQREVRAHQRRVENTLDRQEKRAYDERASAQRSADAQLTRALSLMLDGRHVELDLALKSAYDEFHRSQIFLETHQNIIQNLTDVDGKVDFRWLEAALGQKIENLDDFFRELHLARGAIAIRRKALIADAASVALADPNNPYKALRKFVDSQRYQLEEAVRIVDELTAQFTEIQLKGGWSISKALEKQRHVRAGAAPLAVDTELEMRFLRTASGEVVQVVSSDGELED